tara:strand:+ start:340 stop:573 length:234 start_codon:yes stop_codon:yes gene_type:complete
MLRKLFVIPVKLYQFCISPFLGASCRFEPTCSNYTIEAIDTHGIFKGIGMAAKRISRCHPLGSSGYDPVKDKESSKD